MMQQHVVVLLELLLLFTLLLQSLSAKSNGVCVSPGGRFRPFSSDGKPPKRVRDLTLCRMFRRKTCCDVSQTHYALLAVRKLASSGEANQDCLHLWELLECSVCDPSVGVKPGPPLICSSFCDRVFEACSSAYFSVDAMTQVLAPCGVNDFVCGRASEWISNGTELCRAAGFAVKQLEDSRVSMEETLCYGGKASLDSIAESWKGSESRAFQKDKPERLLQDFQQWVQEMPFSERVSWAVGGLVLTAGLFFMRGASINLSFIYPNHLEIVLGKRKSYSQRQKQAAIARTARKLEAKMGPKFPTNVGASRNKQFAK